MFCFFFTACSSKQEDINIAGSSTVYPITLEAQADYLDNVNSDARITVESTGTGGGFELFVNGQTQLNNASRAITPQEEEEAKKNGIDYSELKIGVDGITVIINKENDWADNLTSTDLKELFALDSDIHKWSDLDPTYPEQEVRFYGPTSASGTYDFFVETIIGNDKGALRDDMNATENDNEVITNVENDKYGIGFLGYSYYIQNVEEIKAITLNGIAPNSETIKEDSYLLSRPLYIYINNDALNENPVFNEFITHYIDNSQMFVQMSGYVPLNDEEEKILQATLQTDKDKIKADNWKKKKVKWFLEIYLKDLLMSHY